MTVAFAEIELYGALSGAWVDASTLPAVCTVLNGQLWLDSDGTVSAVVQQTVVINELDTLHVLTFEVVHGPVNVRIGTTAGGKDVLAVSALGTGLHTLEFRSASSPVVLQFWHDANAGRVIDNVSILPGPAYTFDVPYASTDLAKIHYQQLSDVLYLTCPSHEPRRLERRGHRSWSLVKYRPNDGPFGDINTTNTSMKSSGTSGEVTIIASTEVFRSTDVGTLVEIVGAGQYVSKVATAGDTYSAGIKVTGLNSTERTFSFLITGTFVANVRIQRSSGNENSYQDYLGPYTTPTQGTHYDAQDNQTWYFRIAVKAGEYTSGSVSMSLTFSGGTTTGVARVIGYLSSTQVRAECLTNMPGTNPLRTWRKSSWNANDGWPVAITHGFGRLWFGRGTRLWSTKSDDFTSMKSGTEADAAISAKLGVGSPEAIRFLGFTAHLIIGTKTQEFVGLGNTNTEAVGPTNFQTLPSTQEGGSDRMPVSTLRSMLFPHRTLRKLMQFVNDPKAISETAYTAVDLNRLSPDLLWDGIVRIAVQHEPERRIYVVLESGVCQVLLFRREEDVVAWATIKTLGFIEDVSVASQADEDAVTFIVRRAVGGVSMRFIEKLGDEIVLNDEDLFHLDSTLGLELSRPDATLQIYDYGVDPDVTLVADADVFNLGTFGDKIWVHIGDATLLMTATSYVDATTITASVDWVLRSDELDGLTEADMVVPPGRWGTNPVTSSLTGLDHLEGETVRVLGDMQDLGDYTVTGGSVTLSQAVSVAYAGIKTRSRWKSLKLSYGAQKGSALTMPKAIKSLAFLLYRTGATLRYGHSFGNLASVASTGFERADGGAGSTLHWRTIRGIRCSV